MIISVHSLKEGIYFIDENDIASSAKFSEKLKLPPGANCFPKESFPIINTQQSTFHIHWISVLRSERLGDVDLLRFSEGFVGSFLRQIWEH